MNFLKAGKTTMLSSLIALSASSGCGIRSSLDDDIASQTATTLQNGDSLDNDHKTKRIYNATQNGAEQEAIGTSEKYIISDLVQNKDPLVTFCSGYSLGYLLGTQDVNTIIKIYNPDLAKTKPEDFDRSQISIFDIKELVVPNVFPSVKEFFSLDLATFLSDKPTLRDSVGDMKTVLIITQLPNKKMGIAYYQDAKLQNAAPVSIGIGENDSTKVARYIEGEPVETVSPEGVFEIISKEPFHRNKDNDKMGYYLQLNVLGKYGVLRGIGIHGSQRVTGEPKSHGCFRIPHFITKPMFLSVKAKSNESAGTPVVILRRKCS